MDGVMINAYDILSAGLLDKIRGAGGIRKILGVGDDVEVWIDSGGYQFLKRGIAPSLDTIVKVYKAIPDADYYVALDYPPGPRDKLAEAKIWKSIRNYVEMKRMLPEETIAPVYHFTVKLLDEQLEAYCDSEVACVGGLIPYILQRAGKHSRMKALVFLALIRKLYSGRLHALGLGSAAMIPILRRLSVDSADTQTWRNKAVYGKILLPGRGERYVGIRKVKFGPCYLKPWEEELLAKLIEQARKEVGYRDLEKLAHDFTARAVFNAWALSRLARGGDGFDYSVSPMFTKLYEEAGNLASKTASELRAMLEGLLGCRTPSK